MDLDPGQADYVCTRLLSDELDEEYYACEAALLNHGPAVAPRLWAVAGDPGAGAVPRLKAIHALAVYDPDNPAWVAAAGTFARALIDTNVPLTGFRRQVEDLGGAKDLIERARQIGGYDPVVTDQAGSNRKMHPALTKSLVEIAGSEAEPRRARLWAMIALTR